jgi:hypothetical protein
MTTASRSRVVVKMWRSNVVFPLPSDPVMRAIGVRTEDEDFTILP